ncbi:MAG: hypothetical protein LBD95_04200 [Clostridiales Family XIII bacterium]|jgi:Na+/proline symporter|nr:hypothetical protein [Clostridiales Family XIII bacterium]
MNRPHVFLAPVLATMFWKRTTTPGALVSMFAGAAAVLFVELTDYINIESLFVALPVSVVTLFAVTFATKPETDKLDIYFDDEWEKRHGNIENAT